MIKQYPMVIPEVKLTRESNNYAKFIISPLERGFGTTIGNSLRRVLLSSLEGAAITEIRIDGVSHEFSSIPGVKEDVLLIILQLKQVRLILRGDESAWLHLSVSGAGEVTAADIKCPSNVEIVNPELYLFKIDNPQSTVNMDLFVERGRGYVPANMRTDKVNVGDIPIDAIFSPIVRVNWQSTDMLFLDKADYDRLEFEIWTDGTMNPEAAMKEAVKILINHLRYIFGVNEEMPKLPERNDYDMYNKKADEYDIQLETLDLSLRTFNSLNRSGFATVRDVLYLADNEKDAFAMVRNFGPKALKELQSKLQEKGYWKPKNE